MYQMTPHLYDTIKFFARFPQTGVSLKQMAMFGQNPSQGTLFKASQFLHEELSIRLAHRVKELEELRDLGNMPSIVKVKQWYTQSFQDLIELRRPHEQWRSAITKSSTPRPLTRPLTTASTIISPSYYTPVDTLQSVPKEITDYNQTFSRTIETIKRRHDPVVTTMAQGILEYKAATSQGDHIDLALQAFLDRFYMSRMGIRILIGQHLSLYHNQRKPNHVGVICTKANIKEIAQDAINQARRICQDHYGQAPPVRMFCPADIEFMYVPSHLEHILFELVKNALRAVVERFGTNDYPPIQMVIAYGREDITIKISDQGGGIARSRIPLVWSYMYTTAQAQELLDSDDLASGLRVPMAGFGCGLPLSRLYARYFGGDLKLMSLEGYGTDVYLHLNRLSNSEEPLMTCTSSDQDDITQHSRPLASLPFPVLRRPTFDSHHFFSNIVLQQNPIIAS